MNDHGHAESLQRFQRIASQYGFHTVSAARVHQAFEELAKPESLGLTTIRKGLYGRVVGKDLVHLIKLQATKLGYSLRWGVSLTYVPHEWRNGLRWHRSFKSSRFDLFEYPSVFQTETDWHELESDHAFTAHGDEFFMKTLRAMWEKHGSGILNWLLLVQSTDAVLSKAREHIGFEWTRDHHYPSPSIVYAFTLGKLGHQKEAIEALATYFENRPESPEARENLARALHKTFAG